MGNSTVSYMLTASWWVFQACTEQPEMKRLLFLRWKLDSVSVSVSVSVCAPPRGRNKGKQTQKEMQKPFPLRLARLRWAKRPHLATNTSRSNQLAKPDENEAKFND